MSASAVEIGASPRGAARWLTSPWLAVALAVLAYLNTLGNDFAYDDVPLVVKNPRIESLTNWRGLWLTDWWRPPDDEPAPRVPHRDRLYRPLTLYSFALNYAIGGRDPFGYHVVNVALHAAVTGLVWLLALRLSGRRGLGSLAAVLFAVHPVHADAVASIVGRAEILAALFLLLGLLALLPRGVPSLSRVLAASMAFFAALMAKETAICFPALAAIVLFEYWRRLRPPKWRMAIESVILLAPLALYFPLRFQALEGHLIREVVPSALGNPLTAIDAPERFVAALGVFGRYVELLIAPTRLALDYGLGVIDPAVLFDVFTVLGALGVAGLLIALGGYRKPGGTWRLAAVLAAMTLASYALISNTVLFIGVSLAERLLYWPSAPMLMQLSVAVLAAWDRLAASPQVSPGLRRIIPLGGALLLVALLARTVVRNQDWADTLTLFARDVQTYPRGAHLARGYATTLITEAQKNRDKSEQRAMLETAERHLRVALEVLPMYPQALFYLAQVRAALGDRAEATRLVETARGLDPHDRLIQRLQRELRDPADAAESASVLAELERAVAERPGDVAARVALGNRLIDDGDYESALTHLQTAVQLAPSDWPALRALAQTLLGLFRHDEALDVLRRAVAADDRDWESHANLAALLSGRDPSAALHHATRAYELMPQDYNVVTNYAEALALTGETGRALQVYGRLHDDLPAADPRRAVVKRRIDELRAAGK